MLDSHQQRRNVTLSHFPGDNVAVAFSINENHAPFLAVSLHSLLRYVSPNHHYDLFVIHERDGISRATQDRLQQLVGAFRNVSLRLITPSADICEKCSRLTLSTSEARFQKNHPGLPALIFYRLFLGDIFLSYEKMVYLDCDVLVCSDIAELYETNLCGLPFAAAVDVGQPPSVYERRFALHNISAPQRYFNAGIHIQNLDYFRRHGVGEKAMALLEKYNFDYIEQDALNIVLDGQWLKLGLEWNYFLPLLLNQDQPMARLPVELQKEGQMIEQEKAWKIIHYAPCKPWPSKGTADCGVYTSLWWETALSTPGYEGYFETMLKDGLTWVTREIQNQRFKSLFSLPQKRCKRNKKIARLLGVKNFYLKILDQSMQCYEK